MSRRGAFRLLFYWLICWGIFSMVSALAVLMGEPVRDAYETLSTLCLGAFCGLLVREVAKAWR